MKPGVYNITVKQGTRLELPLAWKDEAGTLVELGGYTARLTVRYRTDSASTILDLSSTGGSPAITLGGATWNISVDAEVPLTVKAGTYVYDLELKSAGGRDYPLMTGRFTVEGSAVKT